MVRKVSKIFKIVKIKPIDTNKNRINFEFTEDL